VFVVADEFELFVDVADKSDEISVECIIVDVKSLFVDNCELIVDTTDIDPLGVARGIFRLLSEDFLIEFILCKSVSGRGNVGIDARANVPILGVIFMLLVLLSLITIGGLIVTDFFLNNGVNIRCSSKRRIMTGCITEDKYERL
jgi:hypothetical protein